MLSILHQHITTATTLFFNRLRLQPIHNIYITSPNLGSYDTVSNFSDNIIKQVPVTSDYGYMIVDRLVSFADYFKLPQRDLKDIRISYERWKRALCKSV